MTDEIMLLKSKAIAALYSGGFNVDYAAVEARILAIAHVAVDPFERLAPIEPDPEYFGDNRAARRRRAANRRKKL